MAWEFVLTRTDDLLRRYGRGPEAASSASYSLGRPLKEMAKRFVSEAMMPRLEVRTFAAVQSYPRTLPYVRGEVCRGPASTRPGRLALCRWRNDFLAG